MKAKTNQKHPKRLLYIVFRKLKQNEEINKTIIGKNLQRQQVFYQKLIIIVVKCKQNKNLIS